jgi:hypothetical protein
VRRRLTVGAVAVVATAVAAIVGAGSSPASHCQASCNDVDAKQRLVVSEQIVQTGATYIEGAYSYLTVRRSDGTVAFHRRYRTRMHLSRKFPLGRYRLVSYVRSCAGTCAYLDKPSDRCAATFTLARDQSVHAVVRTEVGKPCRIRFR